LVVASVAMGRQSNHYARGKWNPLSLGPPRR